MKYVKVNKVPKKVIGNANSSLYHCKLKLETRSSSYVCTCTKQVVASSQSLENKKKIEKKTFNT